MYVSRSKIIRKRSGEDLYNTVGPSIVCVSLIVALCVNFVLRVGIAMLIYLNNPDHY